MMYLQKDLAKDPVRLFSEYGRENDRHPVEACFDVYSFLLTVVDRAHFTTFLDARRSRFRGVFGCFFRELVELVECLLEWGGHSIAFKEGYAADQVILLGCVIYE
jgi:hypothetical protein